MNARSPRIAVTGIGLLVISGILLTSCANALPQENKIPEATLSSLSSPIPNILPPTVTSTSAPTQPEQTPPSKSADTNNKFYLPHVDYELVPTHEVTPTLPPQGTVELGWELFSSSMGDLPSPSGSTQQTAAQVLDIDLDGKDDFVIGTRLSPGPALVWYRLGENGWKKYLIEAELLPIEAGGAFSDIDGDGDADLVFGGDATSRGVWWWENPYPFYSETQEWARHAIKNSGAKKHHDQAFGDVDGDGADELIFWNQGGKTLYFSEVPADPKTGPWPIEDIFTWSTGDELEGLALADVDLDGTLDVVGGGRWFKHTSGSNFQVQVIDDAMRFTRVAAGQIIPGGRPEIIFSPGDTTGYLRMYQWSGSAWIGTTIYPNQIDHGHSLQLVDVDQDGYLDVFFAEMRLNSQNPDSLFGFLRGNGTANMEFVPVASGYGNHESKIGDFDGNGIHDILGKPYNWQTPRVDVWLGKLNGRSLNDWNRVVVDPDKQARSLFIGAADLNQDGENDIFTGGWWYVNKGDPAQSWTRKAIGSPLNNYAVHLDIDRDGDIDLLGSQGVGSASNNAFAWAENNGNGNFTVRTNIQNGDGDFLQGVTANQFDPGSLEVAFSWHVGGKGIQIVTIPAEPKTSTWPLRKAATASQDEQISSGDVDRDDDVDMMLGTKWLENQEGNWVDHNLFTTSDFPDRNVLADINQDGRLDVVVGYETVNLPGKLAWYEQPVSATGLWTEHVIDNLVGPMSLDVRDMDADLDLDIVVGEHNTANPQTAGLYVYENLNGTGSNWQEHLVYTGDEHHDGAQVVDIDGDGDMDILSIGWTHNRVTLYRNMAFEGEGIMLQSQSVSASQEMAAPDLIQSPPPAHTQTPQPTPISVAATEATRPEIAASPVLLLHYSFEEGVGSEIFDQSEFGSPVDLQIENLESISWVERGIRIHQPTIILSKSLPDKLTGWVKENQNIAVSLWLKPENQMQNGPARIVSISQDIYFRNLTIGQENDSYDVRLRTTDRSENGRPSTASPEGSVRTAITHFMFTRDHSGAARIYLNGQLVSEAQVGGLFESWDSSYPLMLANELSMDRPWLGDLFDFKVYGGVFDPDDVKAIFEEQAY